ncbi:MAG: MBL fold metallo-hydrolase [Candidatus Omnitrophota bacterium]|jgi:glyoxylase-like metal-dependent hydrolase (beta-lactamase superfamily II)
MSVCPQGDYLVYKIYINSVGTNCYIFGSKKLHEVIVIDPGSDARVIQGFMKGKGLVPKCIINTHGHIDHIAGNAELGLPICIHERDANFLTNPLLNMAPFYGTLKSSPKASRLLKDNDIIEVADISLRVIHTPGHTPGGISLYHNDIVFTGDTLFAQGIGRTDMPYGSEKEIKSSIRDKLFLLDDSTIVYPGHGEETTIGAEKRTNPWL